MESEKAKEIKKALEQNDDNGIMYEVNDEKRTCKFIHHKDILTLINELESENERLLESCKNCHYIKDLEIANGHAKELKDRIAELEKENALIRNSVAMRDYKTLEEISNDKLKQFAERLKDDIEHHHGNYGDLSYSECEHIIDETLKEFFNE